MSIILQSPGEIAFNLFDIPVYFYGVTMALGVLACILGAYFLYGKFYTGTDEKAGALIDFAPYLIVIGLLGARFYYCLLNFPYYALHLDEIMDIRGGGLSVHGMIIAGIAGLLAAAKVYKMQFAKLLDVFACGAILGQAIGRWGNFFNSEAFGLPSDGWVKLFIPIAKRPFLYMQNEYFYPAFLYESILDLLIFAVLLLLFGRLSAKPGSTACLYLILYSVVRIFIEHLRVDSVLNIGGIPFAQLISAVIILAAGIFMLILHYVHRHN